MRQSENSNNNYNNNNNDQSLKRRVNCMVLLYNFNSQVNLSDFD